MCTTKKLKQGVNVFFSDAHTVCLYWVEYPHQINLELANVSYIYRKLKGCWKRIYKYLFNPIYILKVMTVYFFQNVSLVLPTLGTFFYVTVIFGAPPIKSIKNWCAILGRPFLSEKSKYGKSTCWLRRSLWSTESTRRFSIFWFFTEKWSAKNRLLKSTQPKSNRQY